jgi:predicted phosphodiesterase
MRIAVISDVHGNCIAFDAVLADLRDEPIDQIVCLGDMIQGGPQPAETVARLCELGCPVVMGNADAWLLSGRVQNPAERVTEQQLAVREWSLARLSEADRRFIAGFQPTVDIPLDDRRHLLCFHGSPKSFDDLIWPESDEAELRPLFGPSPPYALTGGHTHLQQLRRLYGSLFFNPGSAGFAYRRGQPTQTLRADPWAEYAVFSVDQERTRLEFRRVGFDVEALARAARAGGMPDAGTIAARYGLPA